jgi:MFS transporter, SP family, solute carrier family 2 (myo-inositol transporter), member 13
MSVNAAGKSTTNFYGPFLLFIAGMGGLLYGIDIGIVSAALLYLGKTVNLSLEQTSLIVAAVLGGSMLSSLVAGFLADWVGRKTMMVVSAVLFVGSVGLIVLSQGFPSLFAGRLLQGLSTGVIAVVVPLYLAECLSAKTRGRGAAIFQLMLTVGIAIAAAVGWFYTRQAEAAIDAAKGNAGLVIAASNHAWRGMFFSVIYPGMIFFVGSLFLSETPRWLYRRGYNEKALAALRRSSSEEEAQLQMSEMRDLTTKQAVEKASGTAGSLLQRKYVVPFVLACVVLACNQATGINSILSYLVIILKQAGMSARNATQGDVAVKVLNCAMTVVAVALVDRKGRKFLLTLGTAGIVIALSGAALVYHGFESKRVDVKAEVQQRVSGNVLAVPVSEMGAGGGKAMALTVLYSYGDGDKVATALSAEGDGVLRVAPEGATSGTLRIEHASYGPVPTERTGWMVGICLAVFIASFAIGPGVVVWLALSELMPTRIRSGGMGIALLINQGVSTLIAGVFLPVVGKYGYFAMFGFWAVCTVVYFVTAAFFLPETKGKTLEEIELGFAGVGEA